MPAPAGGTDPPGGRLGHSGRPGGGLWPYTASGATLAVLAGMVGLPLAFVLLGAFLTDPLDLSAGLSLSTLASVYASATMLTSLWQTVVVSVVIGVLATAFGGVLAWILTRVQLAHSGALETMVVVPLFLSPLVGTIAWMSLASPRSGLLNALLGSAGAPEWLRLNVTSVWGIVFVLTFHYVPYGYLFCSAVLRNMDAGLEEASYMCGAGIGRTTMRILAPLLRSGVGSSVLFITILAAGEFSVPAILGASSRYVPLSVRIYDAVYGFPQDYPRAAAISTMLVTLSLVAMYFYRRGLRDSRRFVTVSGRGFATHRLVPGRWRNPIRAVLALYFLVTVLLPYSALLLIVFTRFRTGDLANLVFTLDNLRAVLAAPDVHDAITNTVVLSIVVPACCVLFGVILVYGSDRLRLPGGGLANYLATAPIAVSGIVFATGVLVVYIRTPLYTTIWLIAIALVAHYLAHAVRIAGNGLGQLDVSLEEAARMNGAARPRVLRTIVMPLLRPSMLSAFILIYVFSVREVNTAIMLYSPTSLLLSVLSWNYLADGTLPQAAVVGVVQTVLMVSGIVVARFVLGVRTTRSAL